MKTTGSRSTCLGLFLASDPAVIAEIDAAADHHIDVFIFDWYWDNEGIYWERGLENRFLQATNNNRIKFALMWAMWGFCDMFPFSWDNPLMSFIPASLPRGLLNAPVII